MKNLILPLLLILFFTSNNYGQNVFEAPGAGATIIVHGWDPDGQAPAWMDAMANAIMERTGREGSIGTINVTGSKGNLSATCDPWNFNVTAQSSGEIVVLVNWTAAANHLSTNITAQEVAAVVAPKLYQSENGQNPVAELPLHLIGHSRGGGMAFEIARLLGLQGIEVDQVTALDPHPLTANDPQPILGNATIDTPIKVYENILFADVYYQNIEFPTGEYVDGAYNRLWTSLTGGYHDETGYSYNILGSEYNFSDHLNIILAYHGTVDLTTPLSNGEATLTQTERDNWFNAYENSGENAGFKYSRQISGNRKSPDIPVTDGDAIIDGYHNDTLPGGNGARESLTWTNAVWPNILEIAVSKNSSPLPSGAHNLADADELEIKFFYRSYAKASTVTFYADLDRNPYNTNKTEIGTLDLTATGSTITANSINRAVTDLIVGETYYIYTEIDDGTNSRFLYSPHEFNMAPSATEPSAGNGSETNPFEIETLENLYWITQNAAFWNANYIQTADINAAETETWFAGEGFPPIGTETTPFTGSYNGDNYTISNLHINRDADYIGLFGYVGTSSDHASLKNIILENVDINCAAANTWIGAGALAGIIYGQVDNCHSSGAVNGDIGAGGLIGALETGNVTNSSSSCSVTGTDVIGGFIGWGSNIQNCFSTGDVSGPVEDIYGATWAGGFAGYNDGEIYNCYSTGNVTGTYMLGGFVGEVRHSSGSAPIISNCYAWGNVMSPSASPVGDIGAFAGESDDNGHGEGVEILYSYAIGSVVYENESNPTDKGFVGSDIGPNTYTANFFNSSTSEQTSGIGASPQITSGMQTGSTFTDASWDFMGETTNGENDYWGINQNENNGYPFLKWQGYKLYTEVTENPTTESLQCPTKLENITLTGGTANTDGSFAFANPTDIPQAGTSQHEVFFTPTDEENYSTVSLMVGVTVEDNTAPTITCIANQEVDADATGSYTVQGTEFDPIDANDNCGVASIINDFNSSATLNDEELTTGTYTITWTVSDNAGNENSCSFDVTVGTTVGIDDLAEGGISVYPNPFSDYLIIETNGNKEKTGFEIFNSVGQIVYQGEVIDKSTVNTSSFPTGGYLVKFEDGNTFEFRKVIKE